MRRSFYLHVEGGNTYALSLIVVKGLQAIVEELEAIAYPLFLRAGGRPVAHLQPVSSRVLLAEVERFAPKLADLMVPGVRFSDRQGTVLGSMYAGLGGGELNAGLFTSRDGIRVELASFPPPVGFRSRPGLLAGRYECYFSEIRFAADGTAAGLRTAAMGGSGTPVELQNIAVPPVTRWDFASTAGKPDVALMEPVQTAAAEVYREVIHGFMAACTESLRLKAALEIRRD